MKSKVNIKTFFSSIVSVLILLLFATITPIVLALPITNNSPDHERNTIKATAREALADNLQVTFVESYQEYLRTRPRPENVIDGYLAEILSAAEDTDQLEIMVQFMDEVKTSDLKLLSGLGFEIIHQYEGIPAVFTKANNHAIMNLAESDRVFWIEYNEPIEFHMEKSLMVVNATKTWNTIVRDENGNEKTPIDGTGVTAVVLDTGIDAGHPDLDYKTKTIMNLKSDFGVAPWVEMENSDTSYGHGTHCAGTVAGNGEASAGARRGVAPGAKLIGLSIGDFGVNLANAVGGYEWIYANTKPYTGDPSDHNIRVVSNSWGPSAGKFDPEDVISQLIEKCTVEKNVVSVFAAGNSGESNHDGHTVETNPYGSAPMSIMVAAAERDGTGLAYFSSRGEAGLNETWPDVAAPGVKIWSAAARRTYISLMMNLQDWSDLDPYYFAISGTSMATPHVTGAVALLFQACPSLSLSAQHDDFSNLDKDSYSGLGTSWWDSPTTLVHEAELILEASAMPIPRTGDNGVPDNDTIGWTGGKSDFAQGYGLMNVEHAVAIALTLNELRTRDFNNDGRPDYPNASVYDAIKQYQNILVQENITTGSNKLVTQWDGDWTRFTEQSTSPNVMSTDQSHYVFIPEEANQLTVALHYDPIQTSNELITAAGIRVIIDYNDDGTPDWQGSMSPRDQPETIELSSGGFGSNLGKLWRFNIEGYGFGLPNTPPGTFIGESYYEVTVHYSLDLEIIFDSPSNKIINSNFSSYDPNDPKINNLRFGGKTAGYQQEALNLYTSFFNLRNVGPIEEPQIPEKEEEFEAPWYIWLLLAIALAVLAILFYNKYRKSKKDDIE